MSKRRNGSVRIGHFMIARYQLTENFMTYTGHLVLLR